MSPRSGLPRPHRNVVAAAAAAAAKSIYIMKEISKEYRIWTFIPGYQKCKRDSLEIRISKCVMNMVRHHDQDEREADGARHWDGVVPVLKEDSGVNLQTRIGSIASILEASRRGLKSVKMNCRIETHSCDSGSLRWSDHITKIDELRDDSLQVETIHLSRGSSTRPIFHGRNWIGGRRKGTQRRKTDNLLYSS